MEKEQEQLNQNFSAIKPFKDWNDFLTRAISKEEKLQILKSTASSSAGLLLEQDMGNLRPKIWNSLIPADLTAKYHGEFLVASQNQLGNQHNEILNNFVKLQIQCSLNLNQKEMNNKYTQNAKLQNFLYFYLLLRKHIEFTPNMPHILECMLSVFEEDQDAYAFFAYFMDHLFQTDYHTYDNNYENRQVVQHGFTVVARHRNQKLYRNVIKFSFEYNEHEKQSHHQQNSQQNSEKVEEKQLNFDQTQAVNEVFEDMMQIFFFASVDCLFANLVQSKSDLIRIFDMFLLLGDPSSVVKLALKYMELEKVAAQLNYVAKKEFKAVYDTIMTDNQKSKEYQIHMYKHLLRPQIPLILQQSLLQKRNIQFFIMVFLELLQEKGLHKVFKNKFQPCLILQNRQAFLEAKESKNRELLSNMRILMDKEINLHFSLLSQVLRKIETLPYMEKQRKKVLSVPVFVKALQDSEVGLSPMFIACAVCALKRPSTSFINLDDFKMLMAVLSNSTVSEKVQHTIDITTLISLENNFSFETCLLVINRIYQIVEFTETAAQVINKESIGALQKIYENLNLNGKFDALQIMAFINNTPQLQQFVSHLNELSQIASNPNTTNTNNVYYNAEGTDNKQIKNALLSQYELGISPIHTPNSSFLVPLQSGFQTDNDEESQLNMSDIFVSKAQEDESQAIVSGEQRNLNRSCKRACLDSQMCLIF